MQRNKQDMKKWAKENLKGIENTLLPSFTPDMRELDEEGIRHDVRQSIAHGFFSMMCATETGLTLGEMKRFVEIAVDEAQGKILVTTSLILDSFEENMELMLHAEKVGLSGILLGYPPTFHPEDKEEIYVRSKEFIDATNMHVTLYPSPHFPFNGFHNSGFPLDIMDRLADLPNVVAVKIGEMGLYADAHRIFGHKVLIGCPVERFAPLLIEGYGMQWMGAGCYEVFQSPEQPYLVDYFNLLLEGKKDEAMEIYWKLAPMRNIFEQQFNQTVMTGTYNWHQQKFYQWCTGGNGGITRQPAMKLHSWEADQIKLGFFTIDITPPENMQEFFAGKAAYRRMHGEADAASESPESFDHAASTPTSIGPEASAAELSAGLVAALQETHAEMGNVPALIRPMVSGGFKSRTGQSIQDWVSTAEKLHSSLEQSSDGHAVAESFPGLGTNLEKLAGYFHDAPAQNSKNIKDEAVRQSMIEAMAQREDVVRQLMSILQTAA